MPRRSRKPTADPQALAERLESDAYYREIFDLASIGIYQSATDGRILTANRALARILGYPSPEALQKENIAQVYADPAQRARLIAQYEPSGEAVDLEVQWRRRDGTPIWILLSAQAIKDDKGITRYFEGFVRDITAERAAKRAQEATYQISEAANSARNLTDLLAAVHRVVLGLMPATNFYVSLYDETTRMLSFPYFVDERDSWDAPRRVGRGLTEYVLRTGEPLLVTPEVHRALEEHQEVELVGEPSVDWMGVPLKVDERTIGVLVTQSYTEGVRFGERDLAVLKFVSTQVAMAIERARAAERLTASESKYRLLFEANPHPMWVYDLETLQFLAVNEAAVREYGYSREEFLKLTIKDIRPVEDVPRMVAHLRELGPGLKATDRWRHRRKDGTVLDVEISSHEIEFNGRRARIVLAHDITESLRASERLRLSEKKYRLLFDANPEPMWVADARTHRFLAVNDAAVERYGYSREEFLGMTIFELRTPEAERDLRAYIASPVPETGRIAEVKHRTKDGAVLDVEIVHNTIDFDGHEAWLVLAKNLTEHKRLEAQLRQAQKMEAVGQLAGGVAHDFNNLLTAILGFSAILEAELPTDDSRRAGVAEITSAAHRAAALTSQLLAFSRQQMIQPQMLDLNAVVRQISGILHRVIGEHIHLVATLAPGVAPVHADRSQLEQVVMNLTINARDAMPEGGALGIETSRVTLDEVRARAISGAEPGDYVMLSVSDTGVGIPPDVKHHLFEPFFTTKEQGTGLGLATVYGVVRQSGGFVTVESEPGRGSTFRVYLPRGDGASLPATSAAAPRELRGTESVLLVEDDAAVRRLARAALESYGYRVIEADAGARALVAARGEPIDLLLTDVVMPGMRGGELAERLRADRPQLRVLFMTGYAADAVTPPHPRSAGALIQKPFTPEALAARIRDVLDGLPS